MPLGPPPPLQVPPSYIYPPNALGNYTFTTTSVDNWICPDLLRHSQLGAADGWRGKAVRIFFWILKKVTGV